MARLLALALALPVAGWAQEAGQLPLSWAQLEASGARIGQIHVRTGAIFNTSDPQEDKRLFRWANALHIDTRASVIERSVLFNSGERLNASLIEETERVLRRARYLYDVQIRALAYHDPIVDIEVLTRDTWSLDTGFSAGRSGGANSSGIRLTEYNLLGTGTAVSLGRSQTVDRSGSEFQFFNDRAFGTWTALSYSQAQNSDGRRQAASVIRPFYALDARWAAGISGSSDERIDAVYNAGNVVSQYRHRQQQAEVFGGWSPGLVQAWVQRYSLGISLQDDAYAREPGLGLTRPLPSDEKRVAPFLRYELIEDRYLKRQNHNLMARPEYFALGLAATLQLGWAGTALGSNRDAWLYMGSLSRGFEPAPGHTLLASASFTGQYSQRQVQRQHLSAQVSYYLPQGRHWLFYAAASADRLSHPSAADSLVLGGANGLRGYPLRYQSGDRRALFTLEERVFSDLDIWRLFRLGAAAFFDVGRAWGGDNVNSLNPGWLSNAGLGLRIVSVRSAFSNVLHMDLAVPLNTTANLHKLQLLVKSKTSF